MRKYFLGLLFFLVYAFKGQTDALPETYVKVLPYYVENGECYFLLKKEPVGPSGRLDYWAVFSTRDWNDDTEFKDRNPQRFNHAFFQSLQEDTKNIIKIHPSLLSNDTHLFDQIYYNLDQPITEMFEFLKPLWNKKVKESYQKYKNSYTKALPERLGDVWEERGFGILNGLIVIPVRKPTISSTQGQWYATKDLIQTEKAHILTQKLTHIYKEFEPFFYD